MELAQNIIKTEICVWLELSYNKVIHLDGDIFIKYDLIMYAR